MHGPILCMHGPACLVHFLQQRTLLMHWPEVVTLLTLVKKQHGSFMKVCALVSLPSLKCTTGNNIDVRS